MDIRLISSDSEQAVHEVEQCINLQSAVGWNNEIVPPHVLRADALGQVDPCISLGYVLIAVEDDGKTIIGFARVTHTNEPSKHWLHEIVVSPQHQGRGAGYAIMNKLREVSYTYNAREILFTYDPLESQNGRLYLNKCGARAIKVYENLYGKIPSRAHGNRLTHRFLVRWDLLNAKAWNENDVDSLSRIPVISNIEQAKEVSCFRLEIPYQVEQLCPNDAFKWQSSVFPIISMCLNQMKYQAIAVVIEKSRSFLVLDDGQSK